MRMYIYLVMALAIAYLVGKNSNETGHGFWRSFIFVLLIFVLVLAFLVKQFNG
jgi:uncharacterized membrane protein YhdT